ncbi:hypothetical protein F5884DRAFT_756228 [Xylogone sp. PMI_703]|nr:hypothetical protein F5884DRAFT_756228 [Xylogone sp. PMI_703]
MDPIPLLFVLLFLLTSATSIPLHDSKSVSKECLSVLASEPSVEISKCNSPILEFSRRLLHDEDDDDEEAKWHDSKMNLPPPTMPARGPSRTTVTTKVDGYVLEEDGMIFESGRRDWDHDDASMLVVLMVFAFLCIMVGTEMVRRIDRRRVGTGIGLQHERKNEER